MKQRETYRQKTVEYHSKWLGLVPGELDAGGLVVRRSEERKVRQAGYPVPFTVLAFVTDSATAVSYDPDYERQTYSALKGYDPSSPRDSLLSGFRDAFDGNQNVGNKYYLHRLSDDIPTDQVRILTESDLSYYREFFCTQHGAKDDDRFIGDYFTSLVERAYCHGVFEDRRLVCATDAPDIPYMSDEIVEPGINTLKPYRGKGFASMTCKSMIDQIVGEGRVPVWSCGEGNSASAALAERLGFRLLGKAIYVVTAQRNPSA